MKVVELGVYHQGCWGSSLPEKYPEISMQESGPVVILQKKAGLSKVQTSWDVVAPTPNEMDVFLDALRDEKSIKEMVPVYRKGARALVYTRWESPGSTYDVVMNKKSTLLSPVVQETGFEKFRLLTKNPAQIRRLLNELDAIGQTKVYSIGNFREEASRLNLTEKQLLALEIAREHGYYSWPRKVTLERMAEVAKVSRRGFHDNLRRAEAKVIPDFIKGLNKNS